MTANVSDCILFITLLMFINYVHDLYNEKICKYKMRKAKGVSREMFISSMWLLNG